PIVNTFTGSVCSPYSSSTSPRSPSASHWVGNSRADRTTPAGGHRFSRGSDGRRINVVGACCLPKLSRSAASSRGSRRRTGLAMSSSGPRIIISGAPASGKGTQCELIKERYGVVHLSTGDMLRQAVKDETPVGLEAKSYMDKGLLVPDEVIIGIVCDRLAEADCQEKGWLLDGFPRTRAQVCACYADALTDAGIKADSFLLLNVPDEVLISRVVGRRLDPVTGAIYHIDFSPPPEGEVAGRVIQRSDDTAEKARVRLLAYHSNIDAIKGCYQDIMHSLDGAQPKSTVSAVM
ncbi:unnamed protein product, partial [Discosporangium mesarthrocarpum]